MIVAMHDRLLLLKEAIWNYYIDSCFEIRINLSTLYVKHVKPVILGHEDGKYPIVPVVESRPNPDDPKFQIWLILCPHCRKVHSHSGSPGHRTAHCASRRNGQRPPGCEVGYILPKPDLQLPWLTRLNVFWQSLVADHLYY